MLESPAGKQKPACLKTLYTVIFMPRMMPDNQDFQALVLYPIKHGKRESPKYEYSDVLATLRESFGHRTYQLDRVVYFIQKGNAQTRPLAVVKPGLSLDILGCAGMDSYIQGVSDLRMRCIVWR